MRALLFLSETALEFPRTAVLVLMTITAGFVVSMGDLELRTDGAAIYPLDNRTVRHSEQDRRTFEEPERVVVLVTSREGGPAVESPEGLRFLKSLHAALDGLGAVRSGQVRSLADLIVPPAGPDSPYVRDYLETVPEDPEEFARLVERLRNHRLTDGLFLSPDGRAAALYVPLLEKEGRLGDLAELERWIGTWRIEHRLFDLRLTGPVMAEARLGEAVLGDLARLTPLMVGVVALLIFFSLGSLGAVAVVMAEIFLVLAWTLGAMALCGVPVTLVTTIVPVVLMAMAVADEIHLLERFQVHLAEAGDRAVISAAMRRSLGEIHTPIVLTSLTTALAFLSFLTASMAPLRHFGVFTALGILVAMGMTFTLVPALAVLVPPRWFEPRWQLRRRSRATVLERLAGRSGGWPAVLTASLVLVSLPGLARLEVQDSWVDNFDPRSEVVSAERDFNAHFWGSYWFDVVLEGPEENFFYTPEGIALVEELSRELRLHPDVGGLVTYLIPFELIAEAWGEPGPVSALPDATFRRIAAWVRLIRARVDLDHYVTDDHRVARVRLLVNSPDYGKGRALSAHVSGVLDSLDLPPGFSYHESGHLPLAVEVVRAIVSNQLRSIAWTLLGLGLLLVLVLKSLRHSVTVLVPVCAASAFVLGAMGWAGWPLGIATSMFATLTLGVGVDFALYFSHRYNEERQRGLEPPRALAATLASTGRALRWNTHVLAVGFLVLSASALKPNHSLGILLAAALMACYLVTLFFLPWLLERLCSVSLVSQPNTKELPVPLWRAWRSVRLRRGTVAVSQRLPLSIPEITARSQSLVTSEKLRSGGDSSPWSRGAGRSRNRGSSRTRRKR